MFTAVFWSNIAQFLVPGIIFIGLSFVLPCLGQQKCEPLAIPLCKGLQQYDTTIFPNVRNHTTQQEAALELYQFYPLVKAGCSDDFALFICYVYAPVCTVSEYPVPPCRSLCHSAKRGCKALMESLGFSWPESLTCDRFPEVGKEICIGSNRTGETTQQPPTTKRAPGKS